MATSFGEQLRLAREARGITLRQISDQTRISIRYLEAIEADDYKRLPGGIFNRSFIKAYAKQIGFDEKEALEGYLRTAREQGESDEVATTPYKSHVYTDGGSRSPMVTLLLTVLVLAILSLGAYAVYHYWYLRQDTTRNQQPGVTPGVQPVAPTSNQNSSAQTTAAFKDIKITALDRDVYVSWRIDDATKKGQQVGPNKGDSGPLNPQKQLVIYWDYKKDTPLLEITIDGHLVKKEKLPVDKTQLEITKDNYADLVR